jgi:hypothetical protein
MTSAEGIQKYKELYRQKTGQDLTDAEATEQATRLLSMAGIIMQPMPKTWLPRYLDLLQEQLSKDDTKSL